MLLSKSPLSDISENVYHGKNSKINADIYLA